MPSAEIKLDELDVELMPERAIFLRGARALVVADLHANASARAGADRLLTSAVDDIDDELLMRLSRAAMRAGAKVIVVVGDLTSSVDGIGEAELERFAEFRQRCALPIRLVEGNRVRGVRTLPAEWCIDRVGVRFALGGFRFEYEPPIAAAASWTISGSRSPAHAVAKENRSIDVPAFMVDHTTKTVVLPAFSKFMRGVRCQPRTGIDVYAIADSTVVGPMGGAGCS